MALCERNPPVTGGFPSPRASKAETVPIWWRHHDCPRYFCATITHIAKFMGPTWGPPGSCRPQMGPILAPWTVLSGNTLGLVTHIYVSLNYLVIDSSKFSHLFIWNADGSLQWSHNERDGVSNHQRLDCLLNRLFSRRSKKTSKLRVTGLCEGNSPLTGAFPAQRASQAENVSIWWRHHGFLSIGTSFT